MFAIEMDAHQRGDIESAGRAQRCDIVIGVENTPSGLQA